MRKLDPAPFEPTDYRLLVLDLPVAEKSKGGIILSETTKRADQFTSQYGVVVKTAPWAFTYENKLGERIMDPASPKPGDIVVYQKHAGGQFHPDKDDNIYRILLDQDVIGVQKRSPINGEFSIKDAVEIAHREREQAA